ncbi:GAF domain-containing protein [Cognatilysobacter bugurensis]|uniref:histidine kinase n=1 Tax=Cognatilysobacter bugurensis TaxID=543356 RepID=A0A918W7H2_9GAMM|nr:GAF domain-containing protein [Lysobacter bugurensis]GHA73940.1 histidine kinase [Lysobacter bugurensis]
MSVIAADEAPAARTPAALLAAQHAALEMVVRGAPLADVLAALCRIVEAHAQRVRAVVRLHDDMSGERAIGAEGAEEPLTLSGARTVCSTPIVSADGRVLGTFDTGSDAAREPDDAEQALVSTLVRTAALAIERARHDEALQRREAQHRFLDDLAAATQPLTAPDAIMSTSARLLAEHLGADRCAYAEIEDESLFVITGDWQRDVPSIVGRWPVAAFGAECTRQMLAGDAYVVVDAERDGRISAIDLPAYRATEIAAVICVPLHKNGVFSAAMAVHQRVPRRWTRDEIDLVELVVGRCWETLERARVTRTLQASEARYRAMVEANPECVMLVAPDGAVLQMNAAGLRMVEATDETHVVGACVFPLVAPEHRAAFEHLNERVCRGERAELAFEIVGLGGTRRWMETTAVPLPMHSGGFAQLSVTRDVTARVTGERALADSRARLDYAVRLSGVGFWYCDLPFDELEWDAQVKAHFFLSPDARVTIDTFYERMHADDREATRDAIARSIESRLPYDVFYRTTDPGSDAIKWVRALGGTAYGADGSPIRFDGVTVDVSAQKASEERLARMLDREREQGRLLAQVAIAARTIQAASSADSVLRVVTEEARRILGAQSAVTRLTSEPDGVETLSALSRAGAHGSEHPQGETPELAALCARVRDTNRPMRVAARQRATPHSTLCVGSDASDDLGTDGWLAAPYTAHDGRNLGVITLRGNQERDFTEADEAILQQLAQIASVALENARLYDRLREQDRRKDEFLATLAHELRNPLAPIRTGLQVLRMTRDTEQAASTRAMMERQLAHLVRLVDDLLDVSRITVGKVTLDRQRIDLREAIDSAVEATRPLVDSQAQTLTVRMPEAPITLDADLTRLSQVVANLLHNSAKYTPAGGNIELDVAAAADAVAITVRDDGAGIPADMLRRVFDAFTQVDRTLDRAQGGLGIGLTLVRRLVELHGGRVEARSAGLGRGSAFTITLPRPLADGVSVPAVPTTPLQPASSCLRLLVVDDNVDAAMSLGMLLELGGHEVRIAHSGPDAIDAAASGDCDVVFLDIGLPGFDGYEVARRLRAKAGPAPVLVAVTGWGNEEDRRLAQDAGFDHHLVKPVDPAVLLPLLDRARRPR